jgi:hypothetical protein
LDTPQEIQVHDHLELTDTDDDNIQT